MRGKRTIRRTLLRWRIALGRMDWWKFAVLLFAATFAAKLAALLLFGFTTEIGAKDLDPGRAGRVGWLVAIVVAPLLETLIAQGLVIWIVRKALPGSFLWPVVFSAVVFGGGHQASPLYLVCMLLVGAVWAFGYLSRLDRKGFAQAFWLVFLVHALNNALAFLI